MGRSLSQCGSRQQEKFGPARSSLTLLIAYVSLNMLFPRLSWRCPPVTARARAAPTRSFCVYSRCGACIAPPPSLKLTNMLAVNDYVMERFVLRAGAVVAFGAWVGNRV